MTLQKWMVGAADPDAKWLYRVGAISALVFAIGYVLTILLFVLAGGLPPGVGAEARLTYLAQHARAWWGILGLMVFTDLLLIPLSFALYFALKGINKGAMLMATACVLLFVALDLAITWTSYASLITLSSSYAAATSDAQKAVFVAAASYPTALLDAPHLMGVYTIAIPAVGFLLTSLVMLKGVFSKATAYVGVAHSILSFVSVVGPIFVSSLWYAIIVASALMAVWYVLIGCRLHRLVQQ